jgi:hypothetical protein
MIGETVKDVSLNIVQIRIPRVQFSKIIALSIFNR